MRRKRTQSDPFTGRALAPLRPLKRGHSRPPIQTYIPQEGDYHKRAREHGFISGRRIA